MSSNTREIADIILEWRGYEESMRIKLVLMVRRCTNLGLVEALSIVDADDPYSKMNDMSLDEILNPSEVEWNDWR